MKKIDDKFWYNYFKIYDIINNVYPYNDLLLLVINNITCCKQMKILDAGSGTGNLSILLSRLGMDVYSVDNSKVGLELHLKKNLDAKIILHDLTLKLPFDNNFFDYIVSLNTICFLKKEKRPQVFKEFHRVLKPGGKVIVINLLYYFKPLKILIKHIQKDILLRGHLKALFGFLKRLFPAIKMFYYVNIIKHYGDKNEFFLIDDQYNYLKHAGFIDISNPSLVFGDQSVLNIARK
jgi:SAM-dependent methyltransferase